MANPASTIFGIKLLGYEAIKHRRPKLAVDAFARALVVADRWADEAPDEGGAALIKLAAEVRRIRMSRAFWAARRMQAGEVAA